MIRSRLLTIQAGLNALLLSGTLHSTALADVGSANPSHPAYALPRLDPRGHCRQLVDMGNADRAAFHRCLKMESVARERLQEDMRQFPPAEIQRCTRLMKAVGAGYMGLKYCLEHGV